MERDLQKVVVSGGTGFIGTALLKDLQQCKLFQSVPASRYDISSSSNVSSLMHTSKKNGTPSRYFVHLAYDFTKHVDNLTLLRNVLNGLYSCDTTLTQTVFVYLSSWVVLHPVRGQDEYTRTKRQCEHLVKHYSRIYGFRYVIVRPALVIGDGSKFGNVQQILRHISTSMYVSHVHEVTQAIITCLSETQPRHELMLYPPARLISPGHLHALSKISSLLVPSSFWFLHHDTIRYPNCASHEVTWSMLSEGVVQQASDIVWACKYLPNLTPMGSCYTTSLFHHTVGMGSSVIRLHQYNKIISYDATSQQITVQGGCTVFDVLKYLSRHGMTLRNIPEFAGAASASCLTTEVHGSNIALGASCTASDIVCYSICVQGTCERRVVRSTDRIFYEMLFRPGHQLHAIIDTVTFQAHPMRYYKRQYHTQELKPGRSILLQVAEAVHQQQQQLAGNRLDGSTYIWIRSEPRRLLEWKVSPLTATEEASMIRQPNKFRRPVHYMRRHFALMTANLEGLHVTEAGTYTELSNQYQFLPLEQELIQHASNANVMRVKEILFPLTQLGEVMSMLEDREFTSLGLRFSAQDPCIRFQGTNINVPICWMDIAYTSTELDTGLYRCHKGKVL